MSRGTRMIRLSKTTLALLFMIFQVMAGSVCDPQVSVSLNHRLSSAPLRKPQLPRSAWGYEL